MYEAVMLAHGFSVDLMGRGGKVMMRRRLRWLSTSNDVKNLML
jgi:hypothetical protein